MTFTQEESNLHSQHREKPDLVFVVALAQNKYSNSQVNRFSAPYM